MPRNVGIQFARGKYISFLDSDDLYTKTALEELTTLAEEYRADVVHMDGTLNLWGGNPKTEEDPVMTDMDALVDKSNSTIALPPALSPLKESTFEPRTLEQRLNMWLLHSYRWATSSSFVRRDFLAVNQINFPNMLAAEDMLFNFRILCFSDKLLRVPNITYIIRPRAGSIGREKRAFDFSAYLHKWINTLVIGSNEFDKTMSQLDFFSERRDYRYAVIDFFFDQTLHMIPLIYSNIPVFDLNKFVKKEFHPDDAVLSSYLFDTVNKYRLQIMKLQQEIEALKNSK